MQARPPRRGGASRREAATLVAIRDPHIVALLDAGTYARMPFLVFEYLEGSDLSEILKIRARLSIAQALDLGAQVAEGLAAIHARGIVHRDIKPANLLVLSDGSLKILDLGLCKIEGATAITGTSDFVGTPGYAAPELVLDDLVGPATDLYSLGVVLYECISGTNPLLAPNVMATLARQCNFIPPRLAFPVPADLATLVEALLEKAPGARLADALALAARLRDLATTVDGTVSASISAGPARTASAASPPVMPPEDPSVSVSDPGPGGSVVPDVNADQDGADRAITRRLDRVCAGTISPPAEIGRRPADGRAGSPVPRMGVAAMPFAPCGTDAVRGLHPHIVLQEPRVLGFAVVGGMIAGARAELSWSALHDRPSRAVIDVESLCPRPGTVLRIRIGAATQGARSDVYLMAPRGASESRCRTLHAIDPGGIVAPTTHLSITATWDTAEECVDVFTLTRVTIWTDLDR